MLIRKDICVGCGLCHPYCPTDAIHFEDLKSKVDQEVCYECGSCLRAKICPVEAIEESPHVYDYPRALRKYFSDPNATHALTGIQGRGTEESKSNDVTNRCGPDEVGIAIEVGRPTIGMDLKNIQKITRALARAGIHEIEPENPFNDMIQDRKTGDLKPELMGERVLSAIMEFKVKPSQLGHVLRTIKEVAREVDSVFCLDVYTQLEPRLKVPAEVLEAIESEGLSWRPNAKINMGLGRAWERKVP
ncbi:MAG: 4Fe-4S binding protein [Deltaproteobacteria bacterium]|nr:4Fe-4S binding protein [Deltaproteobacteria bacterium]